MCCVHISYNATNKFINDSGDCKSTSFLLEIFQVFPIITMFDNVHIQGRNKIRQTIIIDRVVLHWNWMAGLMSIQYHYFYGYAIHRLNDDLCFKTHTKKTFNFVFNRNLACDVRTISKPHLKNPIYYLENEKYFYFAIILSVCILSFWESKKKFPRICKYIFSLLEGPFTRDILVCLGILLHYCHTFVEHCILLRGRSLMTSRKNCTFSSLLLLCHVKLTSHNVV